MTNLLILNRWCKTHLALLRYSSFAHPVAWFDWKSNLTSLFSTTVERFEPFYADQRMLETWATCCT